MFNCGASRFAAVTVQQLGGTTAACPRSVLLDGWGTILGITAIGTVEMAVQDNPETCISVERLYLQKSVW